MGSGTGASVTKRIAAPMVGGMVSSAGITTKVIPAVYALGREWELRRSSEWSPQPSAPELEPVIA